jgi:hypothetical protein
MISRNRSIRFGSFVAGLLVSGIAGLSAAWAQDAAPPAGYPPATDPNAPPPGAYVATPPPGAPPQYTPAAQPAMAPYKPFLAMPFIGIHSIQNDNSGTGPGLRVGGLIGARLNEQVSFNAEALFDLWNFSNVPDGASVSAYVIQVSAAPLYHLQVAPTAEIVVGPKLGFFYDSESVSASSAYYNVDVSVGGEGFLVGANLGAFFRLSDALSLGGLVNFDYLKEEWCSSNQGDCTAGDDGIKVISLAGAAQF